VEEPSEQRESADELSGQVFQRELEPDCWGHVVGFERHFKVVEVVVLTVCTTTSFVRALDGIMNPIPAPSLRSG
jgi:hypothetical protein